MSPRIAILIGLTLIGGATFDAGDAKTASSPIDVEKSKLTFDPKTCTAGVGQFYWSYGSCRVEIVGREGNNCVFRYIYEQEMSANHVATVKVPIDSGLVVIAAKQHSELQQTATAHTWSNVYTSFTEKQVTRMRLVGRHGVEERVDGTDKFVRHHSTRTGDQASSAKVGDAIELNIEFFPSDKFERTAAEKPVRRVVRLTSEQGKDWAWLRAASLDMGLGEVRRASVPASIVGDAKEWLPKLPAERMFHVEVELSSIQRK